MSHHVVRKSCFRVKNGILTTSRGGALHLDKRAKQQKSKRLVTKFVIGGQGNILTIMTQFQKEGQLNPRNWSSFP